jgi:hypothetical protein
MAIDQVAVGQVEFYDKLFVEVDSIEQPSLGCMAPLSTAVFYFIIRFLGGG